LLSTAQAGECGIAGRPSANRSVWLRPLFDKPYWPTMSTIQFHFLSLVHFQVEMLGIIISGMKSLNVFTALP
jgi:hypothetical protein